MAAIKEFDTNKMVFKGIIMNKKTALLLFLIIFLIVTPCQGMHMAAQRSEQVVRTLDIEKLLDKKYIDMVSELSKLTDKQKEFIKDLLIKTYSVFTPQIRLRQILSGHSGTLSAVAFSNDGRFALTGAHDCTARLWDLTASPITSRKLEGHTDRLLAVAFSPDGRFALTGSWDNTARLWDLTKSPITSHKLAQHLDKVTSVAFSPDSLSALTGSRDHDASLWDLTQLPVTRQLLRGHTSGVQAVAFSPDGRFALTGSEDCTARLWDLSKSPITNHELTGHKGWVRSVAFSPDGHFALTGAADDCTARFWDLTQSPITCRELQGHTRFVASVAFSPKGRFALTGSGDDVARLWDLSKSAITCHTLTGHTDLIQSVAFSPDGCFALTGSWDNSARLWDLTGTPITSQELTGHKFLIRSVAFSPDGHFALTGAADNTARLWTIESISIKIVSLEDSVLLLKLIENEDCLQDDPQAIERLQLILKTPYQQTKITKLITEYLYRIKLPEKECWICSEMYDPKTRICMQLECCPKQICKVCLDKIGIMSYSIYFEGDLFTYAVQHKCPYCNKPANLMGTIKKYKTDDLDNHHCSSCDKEKCTLTCSTCKNDYYCSKECQAKHWPTHKATCKKE